MSKVINFKKKREESIEKKRRNIERVVLNDILGAYSVIDKQGTSYPIQLVDISYDGCLFQIPIRDNKPKYFNPGKEISLRLYLTDSTYLPVVGHVRHLNEHEEQGNKYMRIGCEFNKEMPSFDALNSFIEFLYKFAEFSQEDKGDTKVYYL
jgi:hypothetical protein